MKYTQKKNLKRGKIQNKAKTHFAYTFKIERFRVGFDETDLLALSRGPSPAELPVEPIDRDCRWRTAVGVSAVGRFGRRYKRSTSSQPNLRRRIGRDLGFSDLNRAFRSCRRWRREWWSLQERRWRVPPTRGRNGLCKLAPSDPPAVAVAVEVGRLV